MFKEYTYLYISLSALIYFQFFGVQLQVRYIGLHVCQKFGCTCIIYNLECTCLQLRLSEVSLNSSQLKRGACKFSYTFQYSNGKFGISPLRNVVKYELEEESNA